MKAADTRTAETAARIFELLECRDGSPYFVDADGLILSGNIAIVSAEASDLCLSRAASGGLTGSNDLTGKKIIRTPHPVFLEAMDILSAKKNVLSRKNEPSKNFRQAASDVPEIVEEMILASAGNNVSDLHIEPSIDGGYTVRERRDGILGPRQPRGGPGSLARFAARIRVISKLPATPRPVEEARFEISGIEVRASTISTPSGLFITLRLFSHPSRGMDTRGLNLDDRGKKNLRKAMTRPTGLIVFTGPTGSGKTTAVFAASAEFICPSRRLITVEDPVEITLDGAMQIDCGVTGKVRMNEALKVVLRHDPDVIIIGEVRDRESAVSAVEFATTGHLVLTTVHSLGPVSAIRRMTALGADPGALAETLHLVADLRLVRRMSPDPAGFTRTCMASLIETTPAQVRSFIGGTPSEHTETGPSGGLGEAADRLVLKGIASREEVSKWL